jgi:hypothetical protein
MHGYLCNTCTMMDANETSRRQRYVVGYEGGSPSDEVEYHRYLNLDLLISQSTYQPLVLNEKKDLRHERVPELIYQRYELLRDYP